MKIKWNLVIKVIGILIFIWILMNINLDAVFSNLASANLLALVFGLLIFFPLVAVKAFRLKEIIRINNEDVRLGKLIGIYCIGIFYGTITPGRLGELVKVMYLKKNKVTGFNALLSTILDRVFDLSVIAGMGYVFMLVFFSEFADYVLLFTAIIGATITGLIVAYILRRQIWGLAYRIYFSKKTEYSKKELDEKIKRYLSRYSPSKILYIVLISIVAYGLHFLLNYMLAVSIGVPLGYFKIVAFMSITVLITLLPISFNGIGTREATLIFLFGLVGLSSELAVSFAFLVFISYLAVAVPGLVVILFERRRG